MDFSVLKAEENPTRWRVSFLTRLVAVLAYAIPSIGGALSSFLMIRTFQALRNSETAGMMTVMTALKEDRLPVTISMYLAVLAGLVVIVVLIVRALSETKTASPPIWFFALCGLLCLIPAGLFWRAEWLTVQTISPNGSVGAGGISAAGGEIANLVLVSVAAAPIVLLLLLVALAVPFKSGSKSKWSSLAGASVIEILLIAAAVGIPFIIGEPQRKKELVELPVNVKFADMDSDLQKETSAILILTGDNKIYIEQQTSPDKNGKPENPVSKEELPGRLRKLMEAKTPDKRIVYLKSDVNAPYESVLQIFDIIRKTEIDRIGLVAYSETKVGDPYLQLYPHSFEVKLPEAPRQVPGQLPRPNPLTLLALLKNDGSIRLNNEEMGSLPNLDKLTDKLSNIFKERESEGVFREGTNEIEKTVFLRAPNSAKYGDFIKLVEAVRAGGAEPIAIQFDDINLVLGSA